MLAASLPIASTDWSMQRGTAGGTADTNWPAVAVSGEDWTFQGQARKTYERGIPVWASPACALVEGQPLLFIGGADQTMYALNLASHSQVWNKLTNGIIVDAPVIGTVQGRELLFWGAADRFIYAQSATDGQSLWSHELLPPNNTQGDAWIPTPFFANGILYVSCFVYDKALSTNRQQAWLIALNAGDGRELWRQDIGHAQVNAPIGYTIGETQYLAIASRQGLVMTWKLTSTGASLAWDYQMPHEVLASPAVSVGDHPSLYLGSKFGDLVALDAETGHYRWRRTTGNWIDNNACATVVAGRRMVIVGSNDYSLYALHEEDGSISWRCPLGGEVFSAPCVFTQNGHPYVAVCCLDNHLYVVDAVSGKIHTAFFTGEPIWNNIEKGDTLWGSPVAVTSGTATVLVLGSYDGYVYFYPFAAESRFRAKPLNTFAPWLGILLVALLFGLVVLPVCLRWKSAQLGK